MRTCAATLTAAAVFSMTLSACGGGGHDNTSATNTAQGLWLGSSSDGTTNQDGTTVTRMTVGLVLDNGTIFELYGMPGDATLGVVSGFLQGTVKMDDSGNLTSNDLVDYQADLLAQSTSFAAATLTPTMQGSYVKRTSLRGFFTYPTPTPRTVSFTSVYDKGYEAKPDLSVSANPTPWNGVVSTMIVNTTSALTNPTATGGLAAGSIKIGTDGTLSIMTTACTALGTIKPHSNGNVYDVSAKFSDQCFAGQSLSGVAYVYVNDAGRNLYIAMTTSDRKSAIAFRGDSLPTAP
jgi:hypothetical protein